MSGTTRREGFAVVIVLGTMLLLFGMAAVALTAIRALQHDNAVLADQLAQRAARLHTTADANPVAGPGGTDEGGNRGFSR